MKRILTGAALMLAAVSAWALQPFVHADAKVAGGGVKAAMAAAEQKLTGAGFTVVGKHQPQGIPSHGVIVVTDNGLTDALKAVGGTAVVGVPIRVGVKSDGTVSYVNPEYWGRAYLRKNYGKAEGAYKAVAGKLQTAFGAGKPFGGEVDTDDLSSYRYMFGMERFDDRATIKDWGNFDAAVKAVHDNLGKGVAGLSKVYEIVYADKKLAVFGVAMNDPKAGEGYWMGKINGAEHIAALPWEVFVVDGKVMALHGRFRTALAFPSLTMGQFMAIGDHPDSTLKMMEDVAGVK
ncbi:MAG: hypothetical protein KJ787_12180 [Gammaproteobacteria bacterium]|nr:hypothetical protein [Gammaproteobacteria bacterium]MBU1647081.1 hypothetical protein [Gammaproteobacteria bacterium]MBU1972593.1 hypothetical protein [Gammaproteobacteria bacterium]